MYRPLTNPMMIAIFLLAAMQGGRVAGEEAITPKGEHPQHGVTWHVANNGIDTDGCGKHNQPCRSISQAIGNAANGDTISVGPGRYGDLNQDDDYEDAGEEQLAPNGQCIVCVNKQLRVISTHGAENTVIRKARFNPVFLANVVALTAPGITFGEPGRGFTIRGGEGGVGTGLASIDVSNIRIAGNIVLDFFDFGLTAFGSGECVQNAVTGSNIGITVGGDWRLIRNVAIANTVLGIGAGGEFAMLIGNVSTNNGRGYTINPERAIVRHNTASGSTGEGGEGFAIFRTNIRFTRNTAVGNRGFGVWFFAEGAEPPIFSRNNFIGNDLASNCGFVNQSGLTVNATRNYWGAPTGPGPDPADNAGPNSGCDLSGTTIVRPFATSPFPAKMKPHNDTISETNTKG